MASLNYDGSIVNSAVSDLSSISNEFNSLSSSIKQATTQIVSAKGFDEYIGGITSDTFSGYVMECQSAVSLLIQMIRQTQIQILSYSQDDSDIQTFLNTLDRLDYKTLNFEGIKDHISFGRKAGNFLLGLGSSIFTGAASLVEGILDFGETGADLITLGTTGILSVFTSGYDLVCGTDYTKKMWDETKAFVSEKHVESAFNSFYDNTDIGRTVKNNAYGFDTVRGVGKGLGYTAGLVGATVLTGGLASGAIGGVGTVGVGQLATAAGVFGFSNGTEEAWADGATLSGGLKYGAATGVWEAAQWAAGAKISQVGGIGDQVAKNVLKNTAKGAATRVVLDTVDSAAEGFVQPALKMVYKDYKKGDFVSNYKEAFQESGGWENVRNQAIIGGVASVAGEAVDARKVLKSKKNSRSDIDSDVELSTRNKNKSAEISTERIDSDVNGTRRKIDNDNNHKRSISEGSSSRVDSEVKAIKKSKSDVEVNSRSTVDVDSKSSSQFRKNIVDDSNIKALPDKQARVDVQSNSSVRPEVNTKKSVKESSTSKINKNGVQQVSNVRKSDSSVNSKASNEFQSNRKVSSKVESHQSNVKNEVTVSESKVAKSTPSAPVKEKANVEFQSNKSVKADVEVHQKNVPAANASTSTKPDVPSVDSVNTGVQARANSVSNATPAYKPKTDVNANLNSSSSANAVSSSSQVANSQSLKLGASAESLGNGGNHSSSSGLSSAATSIGSISSGGGINNVISSAAPSVVNSSVAVGGLYSVASKMNLGGGMKAMDVDVNSSSLGNASVKDGFDSYSSSRMNVDSNGSIDSGNYHYVKPESRLGRGSTGGMSDADISAAQKNIGEYKAKESSIYDATKDNVNLKSKSSPLNEANVDLASRSNSKKLIDDFNNKVSESGRKVIEVSKDEIVKKKSQLNALKRDPGKNADAIKSLEKELSDDYLVEVDGRVVEGYTTSSGVQKNGADFVYGLNQSANSSAGSYMKSLENGSPDAAKLSNMQSAGYTLDNTKIYKTVDATDGVSQSIKVDGDNGIKAVSDVSSNGSTVEPSYKDFGISDSDSLDAAVDKLDAAVKDGKLTQSQADDMLVKADNDLNLGKKDDILKLKEENAELELNKNANLKEKELLVEKDGAKSESVKGYDEAVKQIDEKIAQNNSEINKLEKQMDSSKIEHNTEVDTKSVINDDVEVLNHDSVDGAEIPSTYKAMTDEEIKMAQESIGEYNPKASTDTTYKAMTDEEIKMAQENIGEYNPKASTDTTYKAMTDEEIKMAQENIGEYNSKVSTDTTYKAMTDEEIKMAQENIGEYNSKASTDTAYKAMTDEEIKIAQENIGEYNPKANADAMKAMTDEEIRMAQENIGEYNPKANADAMKVMTDEEIRMAQENIGEYNPKANADAMKAMTDEEIRMAQENIGEYNSKANADADVTGKAELEEKYKVESETKNKVEEEARIKADEEAQVKAEEEARVKAEEEARIKAEEEARVKAEEEARVKAEEEARIKAEEEARVKAEEEARVKVEEETRVKAGEDFEINRRIENGNLIVEKNYFYGRREVEINYSDGTYRKNIYDPDGKILETRRVDLNNNSRHEVYNLDGSFTRTTELADGGRRITAFDANGKVYEQVQFLTDGTRIQSKAFDNGVIRTEKFFSDNTMEVRVDFADGTYEAFVYDSKGKNIRRVATDSKKTVRVDTYLEDGSWYRDTKVADGTTRKTIFNSNNQIVEQYHSLVDGTKVHDIFNSDGTISRKINNNGHVEQHLFDKNGNEIKQPFQSTQSSHASQPYTLYRNYEDVVGSLSNPLSDENLEKIVSNMLENPRANPYDNIVRINTNQPKICPTEEAAKAFNSKFNRNDYDIYEQGRYFSHVKSKDFYDRTSGISDRLYLNMSDYNDAYKFAELFADECNRRNVPFYFKTTLSSAGVDKIPRGQLLRDEAIVIYSDKDYLASYTNICNEIIEKYNFKLEKPPILTGVLKNNIGYGAEPRYDPYSSNQESFNTLRAKIIDSAYHEMMSSSIPKDSPIYMQELRKRIVEHCKESNVDPNNFCKNLE